MAKFISPVPIPEKPPVWKNVLGALLKAIDVPVPWEAPKPYQSGPGYAQVLAAQDQAKPAQNPIPTPTPTPSPYRHPRWEENKNKNPKYYEELLSGTQLAHEKYPRVPQDLLMDISMIESGGRPINQHFGPAQGYFQFEPDTLRSLRSSIDPYSATESAELAAKEINGNMLSRWGVPGGSWGALDAYRRNVADRLSTYYTPDELNEFLSKENRFAK